MVVHLVISMVYHYKNKSHEKLFTFDSFIGLFLLNI